MRKWVSILLISCDHLMIIEKEEET